MGEIANANEGGCRGRSEKAKPVGGTVRERLLRTTIIKRASKQ